MTQREVSHSEFCNEYEKDQVMKAVIYSRFSTDRQHESSITDQMRICTEYAEREEMTIVAQYDDQGISGAALGNRPGALKLKNLYSHPCEGLEYGMMGLGEYHLAISSGAGKGRPRRRRQRTNRRMATTS